MRGSITVRHRFFPVLIALSLILPQAAQAASAFYVQLGTASTREEAEKKWEEAKGQYPALLGKLEFTPREITAMDSGDRQIRVQAGPASSRSHAQRICGQLVGKGADCFIVETAIEGSEPVYARADAPARVKMKEARETGASAESDAKLEPRKEAASAHAEPVLPWLAQSAAASPEAAGRVEVTEAVRVPLSDPGEKRDEPSVVSIIQAPRPAARAARSVSDWVQVQGFANEQAAFGFSQELTEQLDVASLRMRVTRPFFGGKRGPTLNIGPVQDARLTERICAYAAGKGFHCVGETPRSAATSPAREDATPESADQPQAAPAHAGGVTVSRSAFADGSPTRFWGQLGSWKSEAEAMRRWKTLKEAHGAALSGYTPSVQAPRRISVYAKPSVRLRIGPFISREAAEEACGRLTGRGASCLVVPE